MLVYLDRIVHVDQAGFIANTVLDHADLAGCRGTAADILLYLFSGFRRIKLRISDICGLSSAVENIHFSPHGTDRHAGIQRGKLIKRQGIGTEPDFFQLPVAAFPKFIRHIGKIPDRRSEIVQHTFFVPVLSHDRNPNRIQFLPVFHQNDFHPPQIGIQ